MAILKTYLTGEKLIPHLFESWGQGYYYYYVDGCSTIYDIWNVVYYFLIYNLFCKCVHIFIKSRSVKKTPNPGCACCCVLQRKSFFLKFFFFSRKFLFLCKYVRLMHNTLNNIFIQFCTPCFSFAFCWLVS